MTVDVWEVAANILDPQGASIEGWKPFPKQRIAEELARWVDELLFGGAAGPGKTEWGMEHVIGEMERHPRNRGIIFRRVHPSLVRSVLPRLSEKLAGGRARWNGSDHTFTFPNGSVLELGHLQHAAGGTPSHQAYQGAEYGVIFFEEITEFQLNQYEYMLQRLRPPDLDVGIRPHVIATTNPGGTGHSWVKRRFVAPKLEDVSADSLPEPGEVWRPAPTPEQPEPGTRVFVPATMADNPKLAEKDPGYVNRVRSISDRGLRRAMEFGDWDAIDAVKGAMWQGSWLDAGRVLHPKVEALRRAVAVDPSDGDAVEGGDDYGVWWGYLGLDGIGYTEGSAAWNLPVRTMARKTIELARDTGADVIVVERNHGGKWLREVFRSVDKYANVKEVWASEGKRTRAEPVASLFEPDSASEMPIRAKLIGYHPELEGELTSFTGKPGELSPNRLDALVWGYTELVLGRNIAGRHDAKDERLAGRR